MSFHVPPTLDDDALRSGVAAKVNDGDVDKAEDANSIIRYVYAFVYYHLSAYLGPSTRTIKHVVPYKDEISNTQSHDGLREVFTFDDTAVDTATSTEFYGTKHCFFGVLAAAFDLTVGISACFVSTFDRGVSELSFDAWASNVIVGYIPRAGLTFLQQYGVGYESS
ncbi:hypothetical protein SAICODRAFT_25129 [Saitoella complicata NRRL Y-17804]|uniref:uncharacterized protein n=1 Tax=Saitoella complicata (strain BCRC 22490 / CBS 7301 / JCM 7358 / NBRC 10748 / NRRL Y-17804) TaxID=698492 RepID=UPI0008680F59|nr:uncharacterized protein SAICODRAFT_25129 [Saitoella complicata NRRL Y-17804]ODQ53469.1 hypothetical protein SAICODRAFT_25129 [Saitoella complicata NRRL Y-17804]